MKTFPATFESFEEEAVLTPTVTLDRLEPALSAAQRTIVDQIMNLDPRDYGVTRPTLAMSPCPRIL